jgi:hypothetical protein
MALQRFLSVIEGHPIYGATPIDLYYDDFYRAPIDKQEDCFT